jgi:hypothetical protein
MVAPTSTATAGERCSYKQGIDFPIDKNLSFNIDFKKAVHLKTDVFVGGANKGLLKA